MKESFTVSSDITSEADDTVSLETAVIINTESQDSCESLRFQLLQVQEETKIFNLALSKILLTLKFLGTKKKI